MSGITIAQNIAPVMSQQVSGQVSSRLEFITIDELVYTFYDFVIIDVRDDDYDGGHIRGSQNIPANRFDPSKIKIPPSVFVVIHCMYSKERGPRCAQMLANYNPNIKIMVLQGGFQTAVHFLHRRFPHLLQDYDDDTWGDRTEDDYLEDDYLEDDYLEDDYQMNAKNTQESCISMFCKFCGNMEERDVALAPGLDELVEDFRAFMCQNQPLDAPSETDLAYMRAYFVARYGKPKRMRSAGNPWSLITN